MDKTRFYKPAIKAFCFIIMCASLISCKKSADDTADDRKQIITMLDSFNDAAARADFNTYFNFYSEDAVFIGTDASEYWDKKSFMNWSKPYFDKGKAWDFKSMERHIYFDKTGKFAWFDELLNTRMKICRGSGVLIKTDGEWKVQQYVLSMTIPNEQADTIIKIKSTPDDIIIEKLSQKK